MKLSNYSQLISKINRKLSLLSADMRLTNRCNEQCIHCLVHKRSTYELDGTQIKDIILQLRELNCIFVSLTGGEPMLRSDFFEILDFAKENGMGVEFLSNGTLINEGNIILLKKARAIVQISLYGATPKTHDYITRLPGSFKMTTDALRLLRDYAVPFYIATVVMRYNYHEIQRMKELAKKEKWKIFFDFIVRPREDGYKNPLRNRISDYQIKQAYQSGLMPFVTLKGNLRKYKKDTLCIYNIGRSHLFISSDGDVFPNVYLKINIGNIKRQKLKDIWFYSKSLNYLRNLKLEDFECSQCKLYLNCYWDPSLALSEHNSLLKRPREICRLMLQS